jgi:DNA polymerase elongation subunit (family B)
MTKEEILQKINELKDKKHSLEMERDAFDARQMSLKVLLNSAYGSLSLHANTFAGNAEYFSLSITSSGRIANRFITEEQSREIDRLSGCETLDNLANVSQVDTDSMYLNLSKIVTKKFGNNEVDRMEVIEFLDKYMEKIAQKLVRERLDNILSYTFNSYLPQKLMMDREIIADTFISLAPKMYYCRIFDNEGVKLTEPKLKITGLSMIRSNTPSFFRKKLKPILPMLLENDIDSLMTYIKEVKNEMYSIKPSSLAINVSVSSLNYTWNSAKNTYQKWNGSKFLSCPINSRAALKHNEFIEKTKSREMIKDILRRFNGL